MCKVVTQIIPFKGKKLNWSKWKKACTKSLLNVCYIFSNARGYIIIKLFVCLFFILFFNFFFKNFCLKQTRDVPQTDEMFRKSIRCAANRWDVPQTDGATRYEIYSIPVKASEKGLSQAYLFYEHGEPFLFFLFFNACDWRGTSKKIFRELVDIFSISKELLIYDHMFTSLKKNPT